ncbi:hypothetical protein [Tsuneonella mangrovi]|nr:hypothetical protein [Tsuneonella mangrovi]
MAKAIALARSFEVGAVETARTAIVCGCAIALIAAGHALPF